VSASGSPEEVGERAARDAVDAGAGAILAAIRG
jgi:hypothetical protein